MTPDQIGLPFSRKEPDPPPQEQGPPRIPRPMQALSAEKLDELCRTEKVTTVNGIKIIGASSDHPDVTDMAPAVCCKCCRWDLSKPEDRAAYGDMIARSVIPSGGIDVTWEERVVEDCGLVVYLTYMEYVRISDEKSS